MQDTSQKPAGRPRAASAGGEDVRTLLVRFFADWLWPRRRALLATLALSALLAAATGSYPMIIKQCFDTLNKADADARMLLLVLALIVGVTMLRSVLLYSQTVATNALLTRMSTDIQKRAFAHLMQADYARLSREAPGRLVSKLTNDIAMIQAGAQAALSTALRDVLSVIALVASMFYLDWAMSLVVLVLYPVAALPIAAISTRLRKVAKSTQAGLGDMTALLSEVLSGSRLIKTFRLEGYAVDRVGGSFEEVQRLRMKAVRSRARIDPMLEAFGGIAVAGVVAFAYWRIVGGRATVGDFMGFVAALLMAAQPIRALGNLAGRVQEGIAGAESVYALLDEAPAVVDRPGARALRLDKGAIRFEDVAFAYPPGESPGAAGAPAALSGITLEIEGGRTVAFVGRSGAGKTTLVNLVPRLFDVDRGRILIDGQDIREVTLASLRDAIAIVSQDVTLFDDTIGANIALGRLGARPTEIEAAARAAAAHDFILAQPAGYDTVIGDRGSRLSGGQRQRIALARAILKDAPILLLDEATSALDSESERLVQEALARFARGRTTLVIAHRLSTVQGADLICVMEDGRIAETGGHRELIARGGVYARLSRTQLVGTQSPAGAA